MKHLWGLGGQPRHGISNSRLVTSKSPGTIFKYRFLGLCTRVIQQVCQSVGCHCEKYLRGSTRKGKSMYPGGQFWKFLSTIGTLLWSCSEVTCHGGRRAKEKKFCCWAVRKQKRKKNESGVQGPLRGHTPCNGSNVPVRITNWGASLNTGVFTYVIAGSLAQKSGALLAVR